MTDLSIEAELPNDVSVASESRNQSTSKILLHTDAADGIIPALAPLHGEDSAPRLGSSPPLRFPRDDRAPAPPVMKHIENVGTVKTELGTVICPSCNTKVFKLTSRVWTSCSIIIAILYVIGMTLLVILSLGLLVLCIFVIVLACISGESDLGR